MKITLTYINITSHIDETYIKENNIKGVWQVLAFKDDTHFLCSSVPMVWGETQGVYVTFQEGSEIDEDFSASEMLPWEEGDYYRYREIFNNDNVKKEQHDLQMENIDPELSLFQVDFEGDPNNWYTEDEEEQDELAYFEQLETVVDYCRGNGLME